MSDEEDSVSWSMRARPVRDEAARFDEGDNILGGVYYS